MSTKSRGFGTLKKTDPARLRKIAGDAGRRAHKLGKAHEFTSAEAREAGRKGGSNRGKRGAE